MVITYKELLDRLKNVVEKDPEIGDMIVSKVEACNRDDNFYDQDNDESLSAIRMKMYPKKGSHNSGKIAELLINGNCEKNETNLYITQHKII